MVATLLLLISVALLLSTRGLQFADLGGAFDPTFFPTIILLLWAGLAALGLVNEVRRRESSPAVQGWRVLFIAVAIMVYIMVLMRLGFFLSSAGFAITTLLLFGMRQPVLILGFALGVPGALVLLFNHVLTMPLPTSPFTHLF